MTNKIMPYENYDIHIYNKMRLDGGYEVVLYVKSKYKDSYMSDVLRILDGEGKVKYETGASILDILDRVISKMETRS